MRNLAQAFVDGAAVDGDLFTYSVGDVSRLDLYADEILAGGAPADALHNISMAMGAYVGELLVRNAGGTWTLNPEINSPGVLLPNGLTSFPLNKTGKRLTVGPEHSIEQFYIAVTGNRSSLGGGHPI